MGGNRTESTAVVCAKCIGVCVCMCVCCVCVCVRMCERGISFDSEVIQTLYTVTNMLVCARASVCMRLSVCVCERENPQNCKQYRGLSTKKTDKCPLSISQQFTLHRTNYHVTISTQIKEEG